MIKIHRIMTPMMGENIYIVYKEGSRSRECVIIDPGGEADRINAALEKLGLTPTHILITHGHFDHIDAVGELKARWGCKVYIHEAEAGTLIDPKQNLSGLVGQVSVQAEADAFAIGGGVIEAAGMTIRVIHTPGHSPGSVCYHVEDELFTGDLLFYMSVGRSDFPGGDEQTLYASVKRLKPLPPDTRVYPGHGIATTLGYELSNNPFLRGI